MPNGVQICDISYATQPKAYLGDGLYARFDGSGIWVTSENGVEVLNEVFFDFETYTALVKFANSDGVKA
jgi:hypothetical protein